MVPLPRTCKVRVPLLRGLDISGHGRAMHRYLRDGQLGSYEKQPDLMKATFGVGKRTLAKKCAAKAGLPQYGVLGPGLFRALVAAGAYDVIAEQRVVAYAKSLEPPPLVEPNQGWGSLDESLWQAYSDGRNRSFTDLGTYVNKPGDHGVGPPCFAFDLGRPDRFLFKGWDYIAARRLALYYVKHHERLNINYVILGRRLWSRSIPVWHPLTTGDTSHDYHIHCSGVTA